MANGKTKLERYDLAGTWNPSSVATAAQRGTIFRYVPTSGTPALYLKLDDGLSTDWTPITSDATATTVVVAASVANVTVASAPAAIDGITLADGDEVLLKDQSAPAENGVYTFSAAASPLVRSTGWNTAGDFTPGKQVFVDSGTVNADTLWENASYVTTLGVTAITFVGPLIAGANRSLSNLSSPTAVNKDLIFNTGSTATVKTQNGSGITKGLTIGTGDSTGDETGAINISPGASSVASNGSINLTTPDTIAADLDSGPINITTGGASGTGNSGDISIATGAIAGGTQGKVLVGAEVQMQDALDINGNFINNVGHIGSGARNFDLNANAGFNVAITVSAAGKIQLVDASVGTAGHVWTSTDAGGSGHWAAIPSAGANAALSNLASVAINTALLPGADATLALGSSTKRFTTLFAGAIVAVLGGQYVDVTNQQLARSSGNVVLDWGLLALKDSGTVTALNWSLRTLNDTAAGSAMEWGTGTIVLKNGLKMDNASFRGTGTVTGGLSTAHIVAAGCSATSLVVVTLTTNDATAILKNVVPGAGSFDINLSAAATGNTNFEWAIINR